MSRRTEEQDGAGRLGGPTDPPKRWSARRKVEVVVRLLRGEDIGEVSREIRVASPELERWRREFLEGGQEGLKKKNRPGGELMRIRARRGALHPHTKGGVHLSARLRNPRGSQSGNRSLRRALQQRLASAAARLHDPGSCPREAQPERDPKGVTPDSLLEQTYVCFDLQFMRLLNIAIQLSCSSRNPATKLSTRESSIASG